MSEHGQAEAEGVQPSSGLARFADSVEAFLKPVYTWIGYIGALALGLLILAVVYAIIGRLFGASLPGTQELIEQGLVIMIFTVMGIEHMGHEKMAVDIVTNHLPKRVQKVIAPFVYAVAVVILVIAVWQLVSWGMKVQDRGQTTMGVLSLPIYPFAYLSAFGMATLIPIWLVRFLNSIDRAVKR
jgi:TRAP-type C4-dicarboxylate transport system permease small subunit